jgi:hypothetical protein
VQLTLLAIHEVAQAGKVSDLDRFVTILSDKLGWRGLRRKQIGGIFTALVRRGLITRVRQGSQAVGYALTAEGERLTNEILTSTRPAPSPAVVRPPSGPAPASSRDLTREMARLNELVQKYAADYKKYEANRARRAQLVAEIEQLDAEAAQLSRYVNDPTIQALLEKVLPLCGDR